MKPYIRYEDVGKRYGRKQILKNVNFEVYKGEAVALIGDNGSGKSTLLRMTAGLSSVTEGRIVTEEHIRFGYIPERFSKSSFTIPALMKHMGRIEGIPLYELRSREQELYKAYHLEDMLAVPMKDLSKGTLQKAAVIQALLREPDILLLDEPLNGQDIHSQDEFVRQMLGLRERGITILMSCHERQLIKRLASRVIRLEEKHCVECTIEEGAGGYGIGDPL